MRSNFEFHGHCFYEVLKTEIDPTHVGISFLKKKAEAVDKEDRK